MPASPDERAAGVSGKPPSGERLPDATHVGLVRLRVGDIERSLAFYRDVLGFAVLDRAGNRAALGPQGGHAIIELVEQKGARPVPRRGRLGLFHYAILLPDRAALARLVPWLAQHSIHAGMSDHAVSEAIYLSDPDGLGIEIYSDRPRSAWTRSGEELAMSTAPLDVADLMRAADGREWTGMPSGTTIGHVHLHVGDLAQADAFYRETLGFDLVVWSYNGALFFSAGGYHHHLGVNTWAAGATRPGDDEVRLEFWELVLPTPADVDAAVKRLRAHRADPAPSDGGWLVADPFGTNLVIRSSR